MSIPPLLQCLILAVGFSCGRGANFMVGTPEHRHHTRHRRMAAILAVSPIRERDRRAERRRLARDWRRQARAALLRGMHEVLGLPLQHCRRRQPQPPRVDDHALIVLSSDSSAEDPEPQPPVVDLDSSLESLPNIDAHPQFQLPVEPLEDLGPLNITLDFPPPLQHQIFREAYVLLQRLQLPPLQPLTPLPELPPRALTPPPDPAVDWVELEVAVADFNGQRYRVLAPLLELQQPEVASVPEFVPVHFAPPPHLPPVDFAKIAGALFAIAEHENRLCNNHPN